MNKKILAEILKYSNPKIMYIVTYNNLLKALFCPFKVRVIHGVGELKWRQVVWVEEVKVTTDLKTVYVINGVSYFYYHFEILIEN
ncbi:hypothetical protein [Algibacter sp. L4_22]|uniref:hypothetical protein n=1 Tax=Algibacter sp. L4_22 TaxID=2942477 RepID=UPI00201B6245|nr:hypothetical protein [Algibacter sp. L4_22]MCL5127126.1 hypothetical protein [Algibacter sp. L4_22]